VKSLKTYLQEEMQRERSIALVSLIAALFVASSSVSWLIIPVFVLSVLGVCLSLLMIMLRLRRVRAKVRGVPGVYLPLIINLLAFFYAIRFSDLNAACFRVELSNMAVIVALVLMQIILIDSKEQVLRHRNQFFRLLFYLMTVASLFSLAKFAFYLRGDVFLPGWFNDRFALGTSLMRDTDLFIIAPVAAMIGVILFKFRQKSNALMALLYHTSFLLMFYTVIWSGSKKGLLLMVLLYVLLAALRVWFLFHKSRVNNYNLIKNLNIMLLVLGFSALLGHWVINVIPSEQREGYVNQMGFDRFHFKSEITLITHSHITVFYPDYGLQQWYDHLWGPSMQDVVALKEKIAFVLTEHDQRLPDPLPGLWTEQALAHRQNSFDQARDLFLGFSHKEMLLGKGFSVLREIDPIQQLQPTPCHNGYSNNFLMLTLLSTGLVGLVLLGWLLGQVFRIYWLNRKELIALFTIFLLIVALQLLFHQPLIASPLLMVAVIIPLRYRKGKD
jgi:hypothetical protein